MAPAAVVAGLAADDSRVRMIDLPSNRGAPAGPRNVAIAAAQGRYIALLDADDLWHPQKLDLQLNAIDVTGARFVSASLIDFDDGTTPAFTPVQRARLARISFRRTLLNTKTPTSTVLAERELFLRYPFNEDLAYKAREDLDCFLHMHEEIGSSVKVLHPLLGYRITGGAQISGNKLTMHAAAASRAQPLHLRVGSPDGTGSGDLHRHPLLVRALSPRGRGRM